MNRNERRRQRTRQQLLDSTAALLTELGYDTLTVQDITDDADVARATFYIHFRDKEEAVWVVLEEYFAELMQQLTALDEPEPKRRRYRKFVGLFAFVEANRPLISMLLSEKSHIKVVQQIGRFMMESLREDLASGRVARTTTLPIAFEANFYAGAILQVIAWWLTESPTTTPAELAAMVYQIVLREPAPGVKHKSINVV